MNQKRRNEVAKAIALLTQAQDIISAAADAEREAYENMPESLQGSEKGEAADLAATALEDANDEVGELIDKLNDAVSD